MVPLAKNKIKPKYKSKHKIQLHNIVKRTYKSKVRRVRNIQKVNNFLLITTPTFVAHNLHFSDAVREGQTSVKWLVHTVYY